MHARLQALAASAAALTLIPLAAAPALAGRLVVDDPRGDMLKVEEGATSGEPAPGATIGDVVRTGFRHTDHRVRVRVRFADLAPTGKRLNLWMDLRDEDGRKFILGVEATRADRDGHPILMTWRGRDVDCRVHHRIRYGKDVIRVSVPRRCLGGPQSLRFRVLTEHVRGDWTYAYLDNGLSEDMDDRTWSRRVRRG
jgi:hypothetical protein